MSALPERRHPVLTLVKGGRNQREMVTVSRRDWDELRAELRASVDERRAFASLALAAARRSQVALANGHSPASLLDSLERAAVREGIRALNAGVDDDGPVVA